MQDSPISDPDQPPSCHVPFHTLSIDESLRQLHCSRTGLSDAEAARRLAQYGPNSLRTPRRRTLAAMLLSQLSDPMILILLVTAAISFFLGEQLEAGVVVFIVAVNATIGLAQERKAASAIEALRKMTSPHARALRQGEESIVPAEELVPGDVVLLDDGSLAPADLRLIRSASLQTQEASLTGESLPAEKDADTLCEADAPLGDRFNMVYAGSLVVSGRAEGVVTATGMKTETGHIAEMLEEGEDSGLDTPLKRKLSAVGRTLSIVGILICILIFVLGAFSGMPLVPLFMTSVALAISVIPEGLPATATIVLALGVHRMARAHALVTHLPAVETLGCATVICCDKTGTLTLNRMTVEKAASAEDLITGKMRTLAQNREDALFRELMLSGAFCNNASYDPDHAGMILGDPTEGALLELARFCGCDQEELERSNPRVFEQPFDSVRRMMSTINSTPEGLRLSVKGSLDNVLARCTMIRTAGGVRRLTEQDRAKIFAVSEKMASRALRVLGFAMQRVTEIPDNDDADLEHDLIFLGITGMIDPPRPEVASAIEECHGAGIRVVMITGDHPATALAIAGKLGIAQEMTQVMTGKELAALSEKELDEACRRIAVYARVSPSDKLRIVKALKANQEITAMTGDGVNDAPALGAADIGCAMGRNGTDVAKNAADMILLDDDFSTIVRAVEEGRRVYRNLQKVIQYLLAGNVGEILTLLTAVLAGWAPPVLAVHLLWINLATDTMPALALGVDAAPQGVMDCPPVRSGSLFEPPLVVRILLHGMFIGLATIGAFLSLRGLGYAESVTGAFAVLTFSQLIHAFSQRSDRDSAFLPHKVNRALLVALVAAGGSTALLLFVPALQKIFSLTSLPSEAWRTVLLFMLLPLGLTELLKACKRLFRFSWC